MSSKFAKRKSSTVSGAPQGERGVTLEDFWAHGPSGMFIYMPCREPWSATSVNAVIERQPVLNKNGVPVTDANGKTKTMPAATWLLKFRRVEQMTWCPGEPPLIHDRLAVDGGWIHRPEVTALNLYRPPRIALGDATKAARWIEHVRTVFPDDAAHIIRWLAQRVQFPGIKINHALVLGGEPRIGKDIMLAPVRQAVGEWNWREVTPANLLSGFTPFAKAVILRMNEARDMGDVDRFRLYDAMKIYTATPPETLRVNEKHIREYYVFNVVGVIITTNHKLDCLYLPANDLRHYVAWSPRTRKDFPDDYFVELAAWYEDGGTGHVAAYLSELDLSGFDPKAPPKLTPAFWEIVNAGQAPEEDELADAIERLGAKRYPGATEPDGTEQKRPDVFAVPELIAVAPELEWLLDPKRRRSIPHKLHRCGYLACRNPDSKEGRWKVKGKNTTLYASAALSTPERVKATRAYCDAAV